MLFTQKRLVMRRRAIANPPSGHELILRKRLAELNHDGPRQLLEQAVEVTEIAKKVRRPAVGRFSGGKLLQRDQS